MFNGQVVGVQMRLLQVIVHRSQLPARLFRWDWRERTKDQPLSRRQVGDTRKRWRCGGANEKCGTENPDVVEQPGAATNRRAAVTANIPCETEPRTEIFLAGIDKWRADRHGRIMEDVAHRCAIAVDFHGRSRTLVAQAKIE